MHPRCYPTPGLLYAAPMRARQRRCRQERRREPGQPVPGDPNTVASCTDYLRGLRRLVRTFQTMARFGNCAGIRELPVP